MTTTSVPVHGSTVNFAGHDCVISSIEALGRSVGIDLDGLADAS